MIQIEHIINNQNIVEMLKYETNLQNYETFYYFHGENI